MILTESGLWKLYSTSCQNWHLVLLHVGFHQGICWKVIRMLQLGRWFHYLIWLLYIVHTDSSSFVLQKFFIGEAGCICLIRLQDCFDCIILVKALTLPNMSTSARYYSKFCYFLCPKISRIVVFCFFFPPWLMYVVFCRCTFREQSYSVSLLSVAVPSARCWTLSKAGSLGLVHPYLISKIYVL